MDKNVAASMQNSVNSQAATQVKVLEMQNEVNNNSAVFNARMAAEQSKQKAYEKLQG